MALTPSTRRPLYRNRRRIVIIATLAAALLQNLAAQVAPRPPKQDKGPRAVGLVELAPNGKAQLIPVVIMIGGDFYDASVYKAAPVPMALESGVVYEAERTGVSQGEFTVTAALQGPNNTWKGEGKWLPEGAKPANAPHKAETKPRDIEREEGPPVLRRREIEKPSPSPQPESQTPAPAPAPAAGATPPASAPAETASNAPAPAPAEPPTAEPPVVDDPNKPILRRGKPAPAPPAPRSQPASRPTIAAAKASGSQSTLPTTKTPAASMQLIPAISDAGGPEPRPYAFSAKPDEEEKLRKKMLEIASDAVRARIRELAAASGTASGPPAAPHTAPSQKRVAVKEAPVPFDDVQLRMFDLSTSNEPVLVLTATSRLPRKGAPDVQYLIALVAREDIYGDLHKALANVTDAQHLDVTPRMDLIDAVDVDGDGRGELLFRKTSDTGSAFAVYRVIGNQLWPLFEGTPGT